MSACDPIVMITSRCLLRASGAVARWGGAHDGPSAAPVDVPGAAGAAHVAVGKLHACAVRFNLFGALGSRRVVCWGDNVSGQLGDGTLPR